MGLVRPRSGYWPDRNVGIGQTKQTECEYWPDQTDRKVGIDQTKQTECEYWSDQTNQKVGIRQTKQADMWDWSDREMGTGQTEMWVLAKQNRLNVSIGQTRQTKKLVLARPNRLICGIGRTEKWVLARPKCGYWPNKTD